MIQLYHGSNVEIKNIDLAFSKKGRDFGKGFYLNPDLKQATEMAVRIAETADKGVAIVSTFEFDESIIKSSNELKIKVFDDYSVEWAEFVLLNRLNLSDQQAHSYDIVIGPIVNDTVGVQLRRYIMKYISVEVLVEELRYRGNKSIQYFFATPKSVAFLKPIKHE